MARDNVNGWLLVGALGLGTETWWFLRNRAPFAVGDRVAFIGSPATGFGTVIAVFKHPELGWLVDVQWDSGAINHGLSAAFLVKI